MKKRIGFWWVLGLLISTVAYPQGEVSKTISLKFSTAQALHIGFTKTTHLIFPFAIKEVDRGSNQILVQKVAGTENILKLKAARQNFSETNLTVITANGGLFSFIVNYDSQPAELIVYAQTMKSDTSSNNYLTERADTVLLALKATGERMLPSLAESAFSSKTNIHGIKTNYMGMKSKLNGIYIRDNTIFYRLQIRNHSNINYDIESIRFYICDKRQAKRTAVQVLEQVPLYILGLGKSVTGNTFQTIVFALEKFTIPDAKWLFLDIREKKGGRHLRLKISNYKIIRADLLK
jgi:conjugative transposon TraN protein